MNTNTDPKRIFASIAREVAEADTDGLRFSNSSHSLVAQAILDGTAKETDQIALVGAKGMAFNAILVREGTPIVDRLNGVFDSASAHYSVPDVPMFSDLSVLESMTVGEFIDTHELDVAETL